jgi:Type II secretion system (T2SS), protein G
MSKQDRIPGRFVRLLDCTAVGVAMALTAYLCAWYGMRSHYGYRRPHQRAFATLGNLTKALDEYRKLNGNYPEKLADLGRTHSVSVRLEDSGQVVDPWSHPYQYRAEGDQYTLFSFGRDGKRGGEGLDQDLYATDLRPNYDHFFRLPPVGIPTFRQFTSEPSTRGVIITCALAGLCAFLACLNSQRSTLKGNLFRLINLGMTLVACLLTAVFMSAIHIPNYH